MKNENMKAKDNVQLTLYNEKGEIKEIRDETKRRKKFIHFIEWLLENW